MDGTDERGRNVMIAAVFAAIIGLIVYVGALTQPHTPDVAGAAGAIPVP